MEATSLLFMNLKNGDAGHHTFSIYEKDESGKFSQRRSTSSTSMRMATKKRKKKSDGDGSEPSKTLIFSNNNPDGSSKDEIIAETEPAC